MGWEVHNAGRKGHGGATVWPEEKKYGWGGCCRGSGHRPKKNQNGMKKKEGPANASSPKNWAKKRRKITRR